MKKTYIIPEMMQVKIATRMPMLLSASNDQTGTLGVQASESATGMSRDFSFGDEE